MMARESWGEPMTRAILIRHCETASNRDGRTQGQSDGELDSTGWKQAIALAASLQQEQLEAVYSSPLRRAFDTAKAIAELHNLTVQVDNDLRELDQGKLDGLTFEQLRADHADFLREWARNPGPLKMPGGESLQELQQRAYACMERIASRHPNGTVAVVSHNFTILTIICRVLDLDLSRFRRLGLSIAAKSVVEFRQGGPVLVLLNDIHHLSEGAT